MWGFSPGSSRTRLGMRVVWPASSTSLERSDLVLLRDALCDLDRSPLWVLVFSPVSGLHPFIDSHLTWASFVNCLLFAPG